MFEEDWRFSEMPEERKWQRNNSPAPRVDEDVKRCTLGVLMFNGLCRKSQLNFQACLKEKCTYFR